MVNKMLIDATHEEETRVVVLRGERVEEFDLESAARKQLRGNIYLAKVTRVEPSLQAAFVDYGGNRHGFLAFSEIHPDYYQIPVADRQALLDEAAEDLGDDEDTPAPAKTKAKPARRRRSRAKAAPEADAAEENAEATADAPSSEGEAEATPEAQNDAAPADIAPEVEDAEIVIAEAAPEAEASEASDGEADGDEDDAAKDGPPKTMATAEGMGRVRRSRRRGRGKSQGDDDGDDAKVEAKDGDAADDADNGADNGAETATGSDEDDVESVGAEDALEELPTRRVARRKVYKIQEVIKRRQILLVQVVKEERGTKGAALTTYLSLAGRYCVLMPNTARGGGISRKITNHADRKRLKTIATDMEVPQGMGVIVRTAGANRTKAEIRRDYDYLIRLWETIREETLKSSAPSLIYEEGSLIKRSIRDLYNKEIAEVIVEGESAYKEAKAFMKMLMPSHAKHVKQYKDARPLFTRYRVEAQLDQMFSPDVTLPSGGYLVINQTEALVAIDVNSGKSTREHNIENTAVKTNLEAAAEVARQLRLRDLAGLIVIDFIDMEENRNNRAVERKMKESLKTDRARIQVGRISHFGLLEMSRQRIRSSVIEGTMDTCQHCEGTGRVRAIGSTALQVMRAIEDQAQTGSGRNLNVRISTEIALYMLNNKRTNLHEIESRYGIEVSISVDPTQMGSGFVVERGAVSERAVTPSEAAVQIDSAFGSDDDASDDAVAADAVAEARDETSEASEDGEAPRRKRRRRRRGRRRQGEDGVSANGEEDANAASQSGSADARSDGETSSDEANEAAPRGDGEDGEEAPRSSRRRGRRGGRRRGRSDAAEASNEGETGAAEETSNGATNDAVMASGADGEARSESAQSSDAAPEQAANADEAEADAKPKRRRRTKKDTDTAADGEEKKPRTRRIRAKKDSEGEKSEPSSDAPIVASIPEPANEAPANGAPAPQAETPAEAAPAPAPRKRGWWQRRLSGE